MVQLANNTKAVDWSSHADNIRQYATLDVLTDWVAMFSQVNASAIFAKGLPGYLGDSNTYTPEVLKHFTGNGATHMNFSDPTPAIVSRFNKLMFRGAVASASWSNVTSLIDKGLAINQTVHAVQHVDQNVFRTDLRWYAAAAVLEMVTVLLILPMFWGFWTLGGRTTLSPFGIALAFDAPLLRDMKSTSDMREMTSTLGSMKLKYGLMSPVASNENDSGDRCTGRERLGIARDEKVRRPVPGMHFNS